mgnify:FL=1|tara:strand:+ start:405 stop:809 length:405 start_codon:yes stop_codon:yes gene_type:complete
MKINYSKERLILSAIDGWFECQDCCMGYGVNGALYPATFEAAKEYFNEVPQHMTRYVSRLERIELNKVDDWTPYTDILITLKKPQRYLEYEDEEYKGRLKEHLQCMLDYRELGEFFYNTLERKNIKRQLDDLVS